MNFRDGSNPTPSSNLCNRLRGNPFWYLGEEDATIPTVDLLVTDDYDSARSEKDSDKDRYDEFFEFSG